MLDEWQWAEDVPTDAPLHFDEGFWNDPEDE
jgi:hypothetical protein